MTGRPSRVALLVARREVRERLRRPGFWVLTALTVVGTVAFVLVPKLTDDLSRPRQKVGTVGAAVGPELADALGRTVGVRVEVVPIADAATAEAQVRAGDLAVAVIGRDVVVRHAIPASGDVSNTARLAQTLSTAMALQERPPLAVRGLEAPNPDDIGRRLRATYGEILVFVFLLTYGQWVLGGVVEEKGSRVVEVLLSSVPARSLLLGKVLGIGAVAVVQAVVIAAAAIGTAAATGADVLTGTTGGFVLGTLVWFVLGYVFLGCAFAMAGSTVSDMSEAGAVTAPIMAPFIAGHVLVVSTLPTFGDSAVVQVLSFLPPTAPLAMTARIGMGTAPPWQIALAIAIELAAIAGMARLAGKVYERSVLRTGKRVPIMRVLRRPPPNPHFVP